MFQTTAQFRILENTRAVLSKDRAGDRAGKAFPRDRPRGYLQFARAVSMQDRAY